MLVSFHQMDVSIRTMYVNSMARSRERGGSPGQSFFLKTFCSDLTAAKTTTPYDVYSCTHKLPGTQQEQ